MAKTACAFAALALLLATKPATADETPAYKSTPRVHAHAGLAHAVGTPQGGDFGFGGAGAVAGELPIFSCFSAEVAAGGVFLAPNDPAPGLPPRSTATIAFFTGGVRFHPRPRMGPAGPWFGGGAGLALNGSAPRFGANGMLGWDFALREGSIAIGPMAAYTHVVEPGTARQAEADAHVVWGGVHVSFGGRRRDPIAGPPPLGPDADGDGVADADDACIKTPGVRTQDVNTNGCPADDVDGDGIPNAEDQCPQSKGEKNVDPKLHGCPPPIVKEDDDRDGDTVPSSVDACPDEPGQPNADPELNGCPIPQEPPADVEIE
ncbi:MAG: thrombospondin type 3 repeat-containing protein [Labilithrix sp.]|nr:thrombospondin type 3 repeat-containing protein [Labilithrix sp.]MCW5812916.1 thrombospondin type 3 repeat-containing protein [Labilithrix sp.]